MISPRYFVIYKPYEMLSQFTKEGTHKTLANLNYSFPKDVYPVGRLDADSEGLLILTNDKMMNHLLLDPKFKHNRTYLAQVDGDLSEEAKKKLEQGVNITVDGKTYRTFPAKVEVKKSVSLPDRNPPIRFRKNIPTTWIEINLHEGKNRQVRKMTASVGFPTLRLIRVGIEKISLGKMNPGEIKELKKEEINFLLNF